MDKKFDITTIGLINVNLAFSPVDKGLFDRDVTLVGPVVATPGGDAMNEAITAACLGCRVALLGVVGDDHFGEFILSEAKSRGIFTDAILVRENTASAVGAMLIDSEGERNICAYRGAIERFSVRDINFDIVTASRFVNIGSMFILKSMDGDGVAETLKRAKESGAVTSADVKNDTYGIGFEGVRQVFPYLDYFLPSIDEARDLSGENRVEAQAAFFLKAGCGNVAIKMGKDGCYIAGKGFGEFLSACPPRSVVDTSGAGDNFVGGLLTGLARGWRFEEAARFANAVASISIQRLGSNGAVQSMEQVQRYRAEVGY